MLQHKYCRSGGSLEYGKDEAGVSVREDYEEGYRKPWMKLSLFMLLYVYSFGGHQESLKSASFLC